MGRPRQHVRLPKIRPRPVCGTRSSRRSGSTRRREPATVPVARTRRSSTASCAERRSRAASRDRCSRGAAGISSSRSSRRLIARATSAGISTTPGIRGTTGSSRRRSATLCSGSTRRSIRRSARSSRRAAAATVPLVAAHGMAYQYGAQVLLPEILARLDVAGASRRGGGTTRTGPRAGAARLARAAGVGTGTARACRASGVPSPPPESAAPHVLPPRRGASASRSRTGFPSAASASTSPGGSRRAGPHRVSSPTASATGWPPTSSALEDPMDRAAADPACGADRRPLRRAPRRRAPRPARRVVRRRAAREHDDRARRGGDRACRLGPARARRGPERLGAQRRAPPGGLLAVSGPRIRRGRLDDVDLVDVAPTILRLLEIEPRGLDGKPIAAVAPPR